MHMVGCATWLGGLIGAKRTAASHVAFAATGWMMTTIGGKTVIEFVIGADFSSTIAFGR